MDVLKPELLYLQGRCFRINPANDSFNNPTSSVRDQHEQHYEDEECTLDYHESDNDCANEEDDLQCQVEQIEGKKYRTAFHVPKCFFPHIIGTKHATKKRLENETKTEIIIPKFGSDGDICVIGSSKRGVETAYRRILLITMTVRRRQQFTHFISIPFGSNEIKERFLHFKREILANLQHERGIEESIFQKPEKLHMTLCVMVLSDDVERAKAIEVLKRCKTEVLDDLLKGSPLKMKISGVEIMNDDPSEAHVIYGRIHCEDEHRLQLINDSIVDYIAKAGVLEKQYERVKMHITLMNTKFYRKHHHLEKRMSNITINAVPILDAFGYFNFGEVTIDAVHLSQKGAYSNNGYYKPSLVLNLI